MNKRQEIIDAVNTNDIVIGQTNVYTAHAESILHRVIGVLLFTQDSRMVIQTGNKFGKYDMAAGGHVGAGEDPRDAAPRELKEELGVIRKLKKPLLSPKKPATGTFGMFLREWRRRIGFLSKPKKSPQSLS